MTKKEEKAGRHATQYSICNNFVCGNIAPRVQAELQKVEEEGEDATALSYSKKLW